MEWYMIVLGVIVGLILLMILVVIHELGHAIVAKRNGVEVEEFGVGFPPRAKILGKYKGTLITLNWLLPLGGFCKLKGESDDAKGKGTYGAASFWAKTKILFAGVFMNLIAAMVIFTLLALVGMPKVLPNQFAISSDNSGSRGVVRIAAVVEGSPAEKSGLKEGDGLLSITGNETTEIELMTQVSDITRANAGEDVTIEYSRDGEVKSVQVQLNPKGSTNGYLGIQTEQKEFATIKATWSAPLVGITNTLQFVGATFAGLGELMVNLFSGLWGLVAGSSVANQQIAEAGESVAGPVSILGVIFPSALAAGPIQLFWLMGLISLTLTVMNILPIPGLDGGRWYLMAGFRLFKKKLTEEREAKINGIGMMFLFALIILVTIADIGKLL